MKYSIVSILLFGLFSIGNTHAGNEIIRGLVIDNNMDSPNIGAFLHLRWNKKDFFVLYRPYKNGIEKACVSKVDGDSISVGAMVEVKGIPIKQIGGIVPRFHMLSTCETKDAYIKILCKKSW